MTPLDLTIAEAGARLRDGGFSAAALTEAHLRRIAQANPILHAFVEVTADRALAAAAAADRDFAMGVDRGLFQGIPVAFKDVIDVAGVATTCGARRRLGSIAAEDAEVARRLLRGGAVPLGKLATYEFALVGPSFDQAAPPAANPWDRSRITGGSSSGSAAAVAGGMLRAALGTDTGGSARSPAGYCGVVGLKPTFRRTPLDGVHPLAPSLDHVGVLAATVDEAALTFAAIAEASMPPSRPDAWLAGLRIAYARDWFAHDPALESGVLAAVDDAVSQLSLLGARIEEVDLPDYALMEAAGAVILHYEALALHHDALRAHGADYGRPAAQSLAAGLCLDAADHERALRAARALRSGIDADVFSRHDALVTANTLGTAPPLAAFRDGSPVWTPMRTLPFNATGHPALAVPVGFVGGLPASMQIVGRFDDEAGICRIGAAFERATDHAAQRPPPLAPKFRSIDRSQTQ